MASNSTTLQSGVAGRQGQRMHVSNRCATMWSAHAARMHARMNARLLATLHACLWVLCCMQMHQTRCARPGNSHAVPAKHGPQHGNAPCPPHLVVRRSCVIHGQPCDSMRMHSVDHTDVPQLPNACYPQERPRGRCAHPRTSKHAHPPSAPVTIYESMTILIGTIIGRLSAHDTLGSRS
eukprot:353590-Chlamydomonas_euryale.AAC.14